MILSFLIGLALGIGLFFWRSEWQRRRRNRIPKEWPLKLRPFVNNQERRVWSWLAKVMFDQQILVKLPVTRFTAPAVREEATHWYKLLNGVYCTFTVCTMDGKVLGCVDVPGPKGLSMSNQTLKHTLLSQCGLSYWVIDPLNLPHLTVIRAAFLGEDAQKGNERDMLESRFNDVKEHLQAAVSRQRTSKSGQFIRMDTDIAGTAEFPESRLATGWEQNSFVTPLDSRSAPLQ